MRGRGMWGLLVVAALLSGCSLVRDREATTAAGVSTTTTIDPPADQTRHRGTGGPPGSSGPVTTSPSTTAAPNPFADGTAPAVNPTVSPDVPVASIPPDQPGTTEPPSVPITLPSPYSRNPLFCDAGSDFYRAGSALFDPGVADVPVVVSALIAAFLNEWQQLISVTPSELASDMAPLADALNAAGPRMLAMQRIAEYRELATEVFAQRGDVVAGMDRMIAWCGADPSGRGTPVG